MLRARQAQAGGRPITRAGNSIAPLSGDGGGYTLGRQLIARLSYSRMVALRIVEVTPALSRDALAHFFSKGNFMPALGLGNAGAPSAGHADG